MPVPSLGCMREGTGHLRLTTVFKVSAFASGSGRMGSGAPCKVRGSIHIRWKFVSVHTSKSVISFWSWAKEGGVVAGCDNAGMELQSHSLFSAHLLLNLTGVGPKRRAILCGFGLWFQTRRL